MRGRAEEDRASLFCECIGTPGGASRHRELGSGLSAQPEFSQDLCIARLHMLMKTNVSGVPVWPLKPNSVWAILLTFIETSSCEIPICINPLSEISLGLETSLIPGCCLER